MISPEIGGVLLHYPSIFEHLVWRLIVVLNHRDGDLEPPGVNLVVSQRPFTHNRLAQPEDVVK